MSDRIWYLASAGKTVGPMTAERVLERMTTGKIPGKTKAWKNGMAEWRPLREIPEFKLDGVATPPPARNRAPRRSIFAEVFTTSRLPLSFEPPHRFEKRDRWRGFGIGMSRPRVVAATLILAGGALVQAVLGGLGIASLQAHWALALPFALLVAFGGFAVNLLANGALAWQTRHAVLGEDVPGARPAIRFALRNAGPITLVPVLLALATLVPVIGLAILGGIAKIPYVGPVATGLGFGAHLLLGAMTLFLAVASLFSFGLCPVIVGFEETNWRGTVQVLFDFVKRSAARFLLWSILPGVALWGYAGAVVFAAALVVAIPAAIVGGILMPDLIAGTLDPDALTPGLLPGLVAVAGWILVLGALIAGLLQSVLNGIVCMLYLAGRKGNEDLVTRETWLARRAEQAQAASN